MAELALDPAGAAAPGTRANVFLIVGSVLLAIMVTLAVFGRFITPYDPNAQDLLLILDPPSSSHWFGMDQIGRDILSRLIAGTSATLTIALASVAIASVIGVALGVASGYLGGVVDRVVTVVVDLLLTIPGMVLAIAVVSAVGASATGLTVAITVSFVPQIARLVRGRVLEVSQEEYVHAARTIGVGQMRIVLRHLLPNSITVIVIESSLLAGQAVLTTSALGFLGLGVQPPDAEWGAMLGSAREFLDTAPHLVIAPGLAITLLVFAFNMLGDGLRDRFDPHIAR